MLRIMDDEWKVRDTSTKQARRAQRSLFSFSSYPAVFFWAPVRDRAFRARASESEARTRCEKVERVCFSPTEVEGPQQQQQQQEEEEEGEGEQ